eukprot:TRINITY_DN43692_c0_g1_i1.p1 TRINITY_DN43692_c0_g1~~TRINITY_DN43692_c0_g1_i1.p1  ORF type:complete len:498 (+),score=126.98 TRINITY_DN43692_c0_g1_i1:72-1496(+)
MSQNGGPRGALMPLFEPSHNPADMVLQQAALFEPNAGAQEVVKFPADEGFWDNFTTQVQLNDAASNGATWDVSASHDPRTYAVNQDWLWAFVGGWQKKNPHYVTVQGPDGEQTKFCASEEFWSEISKALPARSGGGTGDLIIQSDQRPNQPIRTTEAEWDRVVDRWERDNGCTQGHLLQKLAARRVEGAAREREREQSGEAAPVSLVQPPSSRRCAVLTSVPLPVMALPAGDLGVPLFQTKHIGDLEGADIGFPADANFWKCLRRWCWWEPSAKEPPLYVVDATQQPGPDDALPDRLEVGQAFLKRFLIAWQREFPVVTTVATRSGGRVRHATFSANPAVWREVLLRARGPATPEEQHRIPEGMLLAHRSGYEPVALTTEAWLEVVRMWPEQFPDDSTDTCVLSPEQLPQNRPKPAPAVRLPRRDSFTGHRSSAHESRGSRSHRGPGAPAPRADVPVVQLCLHEGVFTKPARRL